MPRRCDPAAEAARRARRSAHPLITPEQDAENRAVLRAHVLAVRRERDATREPPRHPAPAAEDRAHGPERS